MAQTNRSFSSFSFFSFSAHSVLALVLAVALGLGAVACLENVPQQDVKFNKGRLNMAIHQDWVLKRDGGKEAFYQHSKIPGLKLSFKDQTRDYGTPMTTAAVRSAIGTELNMNNGGVVEARLGYGGCAVLTYPRTVKERGREVFTQNWVVAHPLGYSAVSRVAITLTVPDDVRGTAEIESIVALLDKQVGDAKMPEA